MCPLIENPIIQSSKLRGLEPNIFQPVWFLCCLSAFSLPYVSYPVILIYGGLKGKMALSKTVSFEQPWLVHNPPPHNYHSSWLKGSQSLKYHQGGLPGRRHNWPLRQLQSWEAIWLKTQPCWRHHQARDTIRSETPPARLKTPPGFTPHTHDYTTYIH